MKDINIIAFGTLLKEYGGSLTTGLAQVMWKLAFHINKKEGIAVSFAVTDYFKEKEIIEDLEVLGWTKVNLIKFILRNILISVYCFLVSIYLGFAYRRKIIKSFVYLIFFSKTINEKKPDIIHIHGTNYIYFHFIRKIKRIPILLTVHGMNGFDPNVKNFRFERKIEQLITSINFKNIVFITSNLQKQWIQKYGVLKSECKVILNAYDKNYFFFKERDEIVKDKIVISSVGRIYPLKGQERVIYALSKSPIKEKVEYWIIGMGGKKYIEKLKDLAEQFNIHVLFLGDLHPSLVADKLRASDYMILPSSSEGFGIAFIESIACGTKVIIPGTLPLSQEKGVLNNLNSIIIDDCSIDAIEKCLNTLPCKPDYSKFEVSQSIKHLNWDEISEEYLNLIRNYKYI